MIKAFTYVFLFISAVLLLSNCEEENANPRSYPRVNTLPVTNITEKGASFKAEIYSLGTEKIINHGFVWSMYDPSIVYSNKILLGPCDSTGTYQANIVTSLRKGIKYTVKPFVQTTDHIVYGVPVIFISLGSEAPVIYSFEPHSAGWMDTLTIKGKNFSWVAVENVVKLNKAICQTIGSTDTVLKVLVSEELSDLNSDLSIELAGNVETLDGIQFTLKLPKINYMSPLEGYPGDTIILTGSNFISQFGTNIISAKIGGVNSVIVKKKVDTLAIVVPNDLVQISNQVTIKIRGYDFISPFKFTILPPLFSVSSISPTQGTWGDTITLRGKFDQQNAKNSITIGGVKATIIYFSPDSVRVTVPLNLFTTENPVLNNVTPFSFVCPETFHLLGPVIESITPLSGFGYQTVIIRGKYLFLPNAPEYNSTKVLFGSIQSQITSLSSSKIECYIPYGLARGPVKITVNVRSLISVFNSDFIVLAPVISSVSPASATFDEEVTIEGENLACTGITADVYFGKLAYNNATVVSSSPTRLVVKVPRSLDSIPGKVIVGIYGNYSYSGTNFTLRPPEITSVSAPIFSPGQDITISGKNFSPLTSGNQVFWGSYPLTIKSSTSSVIIATIPYALPRGNYKIRIIVGGYKRDYPIPFEIKSGWYSINPPSDFTWNIWNTLNGGGISFSVKGLGYFMDLNGKLTSYNPGTYEFRDLGLFQQFRSITGMANTTINDTAYLIGSSCGLNRYDVEANKWTPLGPSPSIQNNGVLLSLNGRLYYGLNFNNNYSHTLEKKMWYYNLNSKSWYPVSDFPGLSSGYPMAYFKISNKGYVLFSDNIFCEYNPDTDGWKKLTAYPVTPSWNIYGLVSFVINDKGYVGLGRDEYGKNYDIIWEYNPLGDIWTESTHFPVRGRYNSIAFALNNKAYLGFGINYNTRYIDFYEFDPNYTIK